MRVRWRWCAGAVLLAYSLVARGESGGCHLHVGLDTWAPYQYQTDKGRIRGLDVRLIRLYGKLAGCTIDFAWVPWARSLEELKSGGLDMLPGASITAERRQYARFSKAYRQESMNLFMTRTDATRYHFQHFDQMIPANFHIAVTRDYYYGPAFDKAMENPRFRDLVTKVPEVALVFRMVGAGHTQGCLADSLVGKYWIRKLGLQEQVRMTSMQANSDEVHLMFSRKTVPPDVVTRFNAAIEKAKARGDYAHILKQYQ